MLPPEFKALYIHLICVANVAGVFEIDLDSFKFHIKTDTLTRDDIFTAFGNRVQPIPHHPDKGIIVGYVAFQHSFPKNSTQWQWVTRELEKVGLTMTDLEAMRAKEGEQLMLSLEPEGNEPHEKTKPIRNIIPPETEWVRAYCSTRNNGIDAQTFCDFYESKGWKVGNQRMKDWQAAIRTWEKDRGRNAAPTQSPVKQAVSKATTRKVF